LATPRTQHINAISRSHDEASPPPARTGP
jgi:hypothetical protein